MVPFDVSDLVWDPVLRKGMDDLKKAKKIPVSMPQGPETLFVKI